MKYLREKLEEHSERKLKNRLDAIKEALKEQAVIDDMIEYLPDVVVGEDNYRWYIDIDSFDWRKSIEFHIPWNSEELDNIIMQFQEVGWELDGDIAKITEYTLALKAKLTHEKLGKPYCVYIKAVAYKNASGDEGDPFEQNCTLVQVGTKTSEVPVWDVKCGVEQDELEAITPAE